MARFTAVNGIGVDVHRMARRNEDLVRLEVTGYVNPDRDRLDLDLDAKTADELSKRLAVVARNIRSGK